MRKSHITDIERITTLIECLFFSLNVKVKTLQSLSDKHNLNLIKNVM